MTVVAAPGLSAPSQKGHAEAARCSQRQAGHRIKLRAGMAVTPALLTFRQMSVFPRGRSRLQQGGAIHGMLTST